MAGHCTTALQKIKKRAWQRHQADLPNRHIPPSIVQQPMTDSGFVSSVPLATTPKAASTVNANDWTFGTPSLEDFNSITDLDIQTFDSGDSTSLALAQDLQSVFGNAVIPDAMWQALGQDFDAQPRYESFL
ncbi:hypothetical protein H2200_008613 [Cladophialophora chaetospira]|uniref:Uncharacterized protein n=1 Tax=Cladophialophora chaetospira TaxID=386627 RepID=A0AA38X4Q7_9EURO|nr:hypothetical protein H2200_008613 [Cladophialophora chaetospira]